MENARIDKLEGPDRIRKRVKVVFDSEGAEGVANVIKRIVGVFITEARYGHSDGIDVIIHRDNSVTVRSYDVGMIFDESEIDGKPGWYYIFCDFFMAPREPDEEYYFGLIRRHNCLYGREEPVSPDCLLYKDSAFDLFCVQCVCEYMKTESVRDGIRKSLSFRKGYSVSVSEDKNDCERTGTLISFLPDGELFSDLNISKEDISSFLKEMSRQIDGLKLTLKDERDGTQRIYYNC